MRRWLLSSESGDTRPRKGNVAQEMDSLNRSFEPGPQVGREWYSAMLWVDPSTGWQVHACRLMRNHFHLVVETPQANLVAGMRWLLSAYTIRLNHRHKLFGHVFSGRYKALLVDGSGNGYLKTVCDCVHPNPARAKPLKAEDRLSAYPWTGLVWYAAAREHRPEWVRVDRLLGEHGCAEDTAASRRRFEMGMEARRQEETNPRSPRVPRRGWCLGSEEFKQRLLEQMEGRVGERHCGGVRQEMAEGTAERIVAEELRRLGWKERELVERRKGDPEKLRIAARVRRETTLTLKAIAARLHLGAASSANARSHAWMADHPVPPATPNRRSEGDASNPKSITTRD